MTRLDGSWLACHPLPDFAGGLDKEERGRVLVVGGSCLCPGAIRLTGEAALHAGAGKVQLATVEGAAMALGIAFPEAAVIALPVDDAGEIAAGAAARLGRRLHACDVVAIGPGMSDGDDLAALVFALATARDGAAPLLLDAAAIGAIRGREATIAGRAGATVMTPHHGELARLTGASADAIAADPAAAAIGAARATGAIVVLKAADTVIAAPDGSRLDYASEAPGLGTAGSGDVLAGVIAGLLARGADPLTAAGWGVWLHGAAGRAVAAGTGPIGYLARELSPLIPRLMAGGASAGRNGAAGED